MIGATSPAAAQIHNNAVIDGTRANSLIGRSQSAARPDAPPPSPPPSDDSIANGGDLPETHQLSALSEQPNNTTATLTGAQVENIIADKLDNIASGEVTLPESESSPTINETTLSDAADSIGQLLARDGAAADLSAPLSIIAAARATLINAGISDDNLANIDTAVETLVIQRFLAATDDPDANAVLLSESRDILQLASFIPTAGEDKFSQATSAIVAANATVGNAQPDATLDLSGANVQELTAKAANTADQLGRLAGEFRLDDAYTETQAELASIRAQLQANGANPLELSAFDTAVTTIARERAFETISSPLYNADALRETTNLLRSGDLEALSTPSPNLEKEIASTVGELVRSTTQTPIDPAVASQIAALSSEGMISRLDNVANALAETAANTLVNSRAENLNAPEGNAQQEYAAIRAQLKSDGATEEQLAQLDDVVTQVAIQQTKLKLSIPSTDSEQQNASVSQLVEQNEAPPTAFSRTELVREARLNNDSVLTESELRPIQEALSMALQHESSTEFSSGNITIATFGELEDLLSKAADTIAEALVANDDAKFQEALELFDQARDEIIRRRPVSTLPDNVVDAFEQRVVDALFALKTPGPEADARVESSSAALLGALNSLVSDAPFAIAAQNTFEGDNGAEPVNIFVIELKPSQASNDPNERANHDVVVTNVIERQLQEAGQSYSITTIHTNPEGSATADAIRYVAEMTEQMEGPTYINLSVGTSIPLQSVSSLFNDLRDTGLVPDELLNTPITQENFDLFADTLRSIALAALDPERKDLTDILGEGNRGLPAAADSILAIEAAAAADIDVFSAVPNSASEFDIFQLANDEGLAGSITQVGLTTGGTSSVFNSNDFVLPEQGEDFPDDETAPNGIGLEDSGFTDSFYRGTGVDVFAEGATESGLQGSRRLGTSYAAPEMLVNAVLGRFDPDTETRINNEMVA